MLTAPLLVGVVGGGARWLHVLLAAAWFCAYFAFNATGLWLKARRRPRYWPATRAYGITLAVVGLPLVVLDPGLLWWAPAFAPLLAVGLWCSWTRRERSLLNDGATVLAACLMTVVAWQLTSHPYDAPATAWTWAAVLWVYFFGTALYVKTMIRERGNLAMLRLSLGYHALAAGVSGTAAALSTRVPAVESGAVLVAGTPTTLGLTTATWAALAVFFAALTARAWLVPARFARATPKQLGIGEIVATIAVVVIFLAVR